MTPWRKLKKVATHDMVGPVLMDELHKSGYTHFPVYQGGDKKDIVGVLDIADMLDAKAGGFVKDIMTKRVYYLHEDEKVSEAFATIAKTKHPLFIVINDKEDFVGGLSMTEVLEHMLGRLPESEFTAHDSRSAVIEKHKPRLTKVDETVEITPDGEVATESAGEKEGKAETDEEK
jgi:CBS domain-containing protein